MPLSISKQSGLKYALTYTANVWKKGLNLSKREVYNLNGGHSPVVHSYSTFNRYMGVARDFVKFAIEKEELSKMKHLSYDHVKEYLNRKIEKGYSEKTIKVNASALKKFFETVQKQDIADRISKDYQSYYSQGRSPNRTIGFSNPEKIIDNLKDDLHKTIAELQLRTGARLGDVKKIQIDHKNRRVIITKSKGGKTRAVNFYLPGEFKRVAELKERLDNQLQGRDWQEIRGSKGKVGTYYKDLRQAVKSAGETYQGAHSFRASYAERFWNYAEKHGWDRQRIEKTLEHNLGHNRIEMSRHYAGR